MSGYPSRKRIFQFRVSAFGRDVIVICSYLHLSACICTRILLHTFRIPVLVLLSSAYSAYSAVDFCFLFSSFTFHLPRPSASFHILPLVFSRHKRRAARLACPF